jgi:hypothetical protein
VKIFWLQERCVREEWESSPEKFEPVRFFRTEIMSQAFKLIDSAIALFDEYDTNLSRSYKVEWRLKIP